MYLIDQLVIFSGHTQVKPKASQYPRTMTEHWLANNNIYLSIYLSIYEVHTISYQTFSYGHFYW